ncbi:MAG: hypothetical protein FWC11_03160 [Firmicutes bacterium]|nr:hypothetical protein [Bacillota bacterium]
MDIENQTKKRGRGRPQLTPEQKEQRRIKNNKRSSEHHKKTGYAAQKKYKDAHPETYNFYEPAIRIDRVFENAFIKLCENEEKSHSEIFIYAIEKVFDITLSKKD